MAKRYWTKKRIMSTDWQIREVDGPWPFELFDPESGEVRGRAFGRGQLEAVICNFRAFGFHDCDGD